MAREDIERLKRRHLGEYLDLLARRLDEWVSAELQIPKRQRARLIRKMRLDRYRAHLETIIMEAAGEILQISRQSADDLLGELAPVDEQQRGRDE
jgi:hypothetical protein